MATKKQSRKLSQGRRKKDHLQICLNEPVEYQGVTTGLEAYYFIHQALPELDLGRVDLSTMLLGKSLAAPLIISSMVGGIETAARINRNLAQAAQCLGLAMGVGSQRSFIEKPRTESSFQVREVAPDILLLANLGAVQLNYGYGVKECLRAVESIDADALILHLNPLQEALQPEGNSNFKSLLKKIKTLCRELPVPVVIKEVGTGISEEVAEKLVEAGVAAIDVAGAGGTCWSEVERRRTTDEMANNVAGAFASWGIPTAESIRMARQGAPQLPIIASGGIRTGIDVAKSIALGADAAGIAAPLLKAANNSALEAEKYLKEVIETLRVAMFCIGSENIKELKFSPRLQKK
jgi:isopentenyl-diphosphate Delta-isomerase